MDPISASASVLTVLNAAAQSSFLLYKFFRGIRGTPVEVERYCSLLEGLSHTFSALQMLHSENSICLALSDDFSARLANCSTDLRAVHARLQNVRLRMRDSPIRKGWERVKWSISSDSWLEKFFARLQMYHMEFSLELNCAQLKLQASLRKLLSCEGNRLIVSAFDKDLQDKAESNLVAMAKAGPDIARRFSRNQPPTDSDSIPSEAASMPILNRSTWNEKAASPNSIQTLPPQYGSLRSNHFSSRTEKTYYYGGSIYSVILRIRSTHHKVWTPWKSTPDQTQYSLFRNSYDIHIKLPLFSFRQLNFDLSILQDSGGMASLSTRFNLSFLRIVPWDAPIMNLARNGDIFLMESLFRAGKAAPSDVLVDGMSLLHIAASRDDLDMIRFLISCGASGEAIDEDGDTPLHIATMRGKDYEIVRTLIESGCDLGTLNFTGRTPLHQHFNQVTRRILLVYDGPVELYTQDHDHMTIAHYLSWSKTTRPEDLHRLIKDDVSCLGVRDNLGRSALHFAVMRGNIALISYILRLGIHSNLSLTNSKDVTLLHYAVHSKRTETLDLVARYCKDIFVKDHQGRSILHYAAWQNNVAAVQKVVQLGGVELLYQPDSSGETPLQFATRVGAQSVLAYADTLGGEKGEPSILYPATDGKVHRNERGTASNGSFQTSTRPKIAYRIDRGVVMILLLAIVMFLRYPRTPPVS